MKSCNRCLDTKPFESFSKDKYKKDGYTTICKDCRKKYMSSYYNKNRDAIIKNVQGWYEDNKQYRSTYRRKHYESNKGAYNAATRARQAAKLKATPSWANLEQIKRIYTACASITKRTGVEHHVDHIIPLQGESVCGLHVEKNLAIIPAQMNLQKSNTYNSWDTN